MWFDILWKDRPTNGLCSEVWPEVNVTWYQELVEGTLATMTLTGYVHRSHFLFGRLTSPCMLLYNCLIQLHVYYKSLLYCFMQLLFRVSHFVCHHANDCLMRGEQNWELAFSNSKRNSRFGYLLSSRKLFESKVPASQQPSWYAKSHKFRFNFSMIFVVFFVVIEAGKNETILDSVVSLSSWMQILHPQSTCRLTRVFRVPGEAWPWS